jgi:hypothetical protein
MDYDLILRITKIGGISMILNRNILCGLIAVAIFVPASSAMSGEFSYNTLGVGYSSVNYDSHSGALAGLDLSGSFEVGSNVAITAAYGKGDGTLDAVEVTSTTGGVGLTLHTPIAPGTDVGLNLSFIQMDLEISHPFFGIASVSDSGNQISFGIRHLVSDTLEIGASYSHLSLGDSGSSSGMGINGRFYTSENVSLAVGYSQPDNDISVVSFGVRWTFDSARTIAPGGY